MQKMRRMVFDQIMRFQTPEENTEEYLGQGFTVVKEVESLLRELESHRGVP